MNTDDLNPYCKDIEEWPKSWEIDFPDRETGKEIVKIVFVPFIRYLVSQELKKKTIKMHIDNIWLLGGEIIGRVNFDETLRKKNTKELVEMHIDEFGGPYSRHLDTKYEINSFNSTCKKLYKFLKLQKN